LRRAKNFLTALSQLQCRGNGKGLGGSGSGSEDVAMEAPES